MIFIFGLVEMLIGIWVGYLIGKSVGKAKKKKDVDNLLMFLIVEGFIDVDKAKDRLEEINHKGFNIEQHIKEKGGIKL